MTEQQVNDLWVAAALIEAPYTPDDPDERKAYLDGAQFHLQAGQETA